MRQANASHSQKRQRKGGRSMEERARRSQAEKSTWGFGLGAIPERASGSGLGENRTVRRLHSAALLFFCANTTPVDSLVMRC